MKAQVPGKNIKMPLSSGCVSVCACGHVCVCVSACLLLCVSAAQDAECVNQGLSQ